MQCVIHLLLFHSLLIFLFLAIRESGGQNNGPYFGQKVKGASKKKPGKLKYALDGQETGEQLDPYGSNQNGPRESAVYKNADPKNAADLRWMVERNTRNKEQHGKIQVQVRSLDEESRQQKPQSDVKWDDDLNLLQQPLKDRPVQNQQNVQNLGDFQQPLKDNIEDYQQKVKQNVRDYQPKGKQNLGDYQKELNENSKKKKQMVKEDVNNNQQDNLANYQHLEKVNPVEKKAESKAGKNVRNQRYRRNDDLQQENFNPSNKNDRNMESVDRIDDKRPSSYKETDLHKLESALLSDKDGVRPQKIDDNKPGNVKEGYNVLPTTDNKSAVQKSSQAGLTRRNKSEVLPPESVDNDNLHSQYQLDAPVQQNQDHIEVKDKDDGVKLKIDYMKKQGEDGLKNKNFDFYQKQLDVDKSNNQLFQEQVPYPKKYSHKQDNNEEKFHHPELIEELNKQKEFHVETNAAKFEKVEKDIAEAQRVIGSDFKQGNLPRTHKKLKKGPARPHPSQRKNVQWFDEFQSYNLKASSNHQFRIGFAPIPSDGTPWPMPQFYTPGTKVFLVKPGNLQLNSVGESCDILDYSLQRARMNMFGEENVSSSSSDNQNLHLFREEDSVYPEVKVVNVTVLKECGIYPQFGMDESYDLEVRQSGAVIIAREVWGAIRGLETFTQLVYQNEAGQYLVNKTLIHDFPRFKHRGVLLDTSRHYLNKETIIMNLEAMAQNKLNVFHWHIVDEQSFPFESKTYPNLTRMGAYSQDHVYTQEMVADIINEGRLRGIRVIPEFDTPGHTFAWGLGQDNLLTPCYDYNGQPTGDFGPINPILKSSYQFLQGLFSDVMSLFKDKYIHLGGDEVPMDCWQTNPFLERFMTRNHLYEIKDLLNIYMKKLFDIIKTIGHSRTAGSSKIVWQEVFDNDVDIDKDTVVQIWMGDAWDIDRVTSKGHYALFSSCWYLNYISYGQDWDKYYKCDQLGAHLDLYNVRNQSLIMGGEVCLWTEYADDENILPRIWPRASAAAERLWSAKDVNNPQEAAPRLEEQRCRMKRRGLPVGVLSGPGFCKKYRKPQQFKPFAWNPSKHKAPANNNNNFAAFDVATHKHIYVVDMNSMYIFPLVILLCVICLSILMSLRHKANGQKPFLAKFHLPGISTRRSVKGLVFIFMAFAFVWCIWTAPIWMHTWENKQRAT